VIRCDDDDDDDDDEYYDYYGDNTQYKVCSTYA
jgi:hypothetical protein